MTDYKKRSMEYCKLEAIIFAYLLIIATLCLYNLDNLMLLAISLLLLLPIKILSTWFKAGQVFVMANYKGDISDLIIDLGLEGFVPKSAGTNGCIFTTNLCLFPNSWCMIRHDGVRSILVGTNCLITRLGAGGVDVELIKKTNIGIKKGQQGA